ncbi:MAG: radical SAM protein [Desulfobacterales bacterium]|nr:radical SAM protein [Desulfobacterales bacterium]
MKRVLLINPFYPIAETPSPPLGLAYLAASLESSGFAVRLLDGVVGPLNNGHLAKELNDFAPHWVGVTAVTMTVNRALEIVRQVKTIDPGVGTVMGGPHVTFTAAATLEAVPELDVIVRGEGEATLSELVAAGDDRDAWEKIPGLSYRRGGCIHHTADRPPQADIDGLPLPARHLIPLGRYRTLGMPVSLTTSRGCPYKCIFCVGRRMVGARVRYRQPSAVVDEMAHLAGLGFGQINLADDLFTANQRHCLAVCNEIIARGLAIRWSAFARVDTVSPKILTRMQAAGCQAVSFGIESGNPDILQRVKKGIRLEQVVQAVKMCRAAGIAPHASFILGLPGETEETLVQTLAFGQRLEREGLCYGFHLLAPFPGTAVHDRVADYGLEILSTNWDDYHANRAVCTPAGLDPAVLDAQAEEWEQRLHLYLEDIRRKMDRGAASPEEEAQILNMERTVIIYELMMGDVLRQTNLNTNKAASEEDLLGELARQAAAKLPAFTPAQIADALQEAQRREGLRQIRRGDFIQWEWVDYL